MQQSSFLSAVLVQAIKGAYTGTNRPTYLINQAVQEGYFLEACNLFQLNYPTEVPITTVIVNRLSNPIPNILSWRNFLGFVLFVLTHSSRPLTATSPPIAVFDSLMHRPLHPDNIPIALAGLIYARAEVGELVRLPPHLAPFFQKVTGFYSISVLCNHLLSIWTQRIKENPIPRQQPSRSFLNSQSQTLLSQYIETLRVKIAQLKDHEITAIQFQQDIEQLLNGSEIIRNLENVSRIHRLSMQIRNEGLRMISEIAEAAREIVSQFANPALKSPRVFQIAFSIRNCFASDISFPKACFLAELYSMIVTKSQEPTESDAIDSKIATFVAALNSFENDLKSKVFTSLVGPYNSCIANPKVRDDQLRSTKDVSVGLLQNLKQILLFCQYAITCVALDKLVNVERICFLQYSGVEVGDVEGVLREAEENLRASLAGDQVFRKVFLKLKDLFPDMGGLETLKFSEELPEWKFGCGISGMTADVVWKVKCEVMESLGLMEKAVIGVRSFVKCPKCKGVMVVSNMALCGNCEKFVCCKKCKKTGCPVCGE
jgi:hypothetical protein